MMHSAPMITAIDTNIAYARRRLTSTTAFADGGVTGRGAALVDLTRRESIIPCSIRPRQCRQTIRYDAEADPFAGLDRAFGLRNPLEPSEAVDVELEAYL